MCVIVYMCVCTCVCVCVHVCVLIGMPCKLLHIISALLYSLMVCVMAVACGS